MSVWRVLAPIVMLLVVVGVVSLLVSSGALSGFERSPAAAPTTVETLELPLTPGGAGTETTGGAAAGG